MKKIIFLLIVGIVTSLSAQEKPKIKGSKVVTEMSKSINEYFNILEIDDALKVMIVQGSESGYSIKTDDNLMDVIKFNVTDSILKIYTTNRIVKSKKLEIELTVNGIEQITLKNDAEIKGKGWLFSEKLHLNADNSSRFDLGVQADDVVVKLQYNAGGKLKIKSKKTTIVMNDRTDVQASINSDITKVTLTKSAQLALSGDSDYVDYNASDKAELEAKKMKTSSALLYASNSADVHVRARKSLELYAHGTSKVYVYGDPKLDVKGITDKSKIIKK